MGAEAHWPCTNGLHPVRQCGRVLRVHGILPHSADIPTRVRRGSQWRGGAKPHGPKIRSWGQKLNKKGVLCCVEAARFCGEASHVDVTPPPCQCALLACEWPSLLRTMTVAWPLWTAWSWRCVHVWVDAVAQHVYVRLNCMVL